MTMHYILKCSTCDKVISQCRCMAGNKDVKYKVCDECREKDRTNINQNAWPEKIIVRLA